MLHLLTAFSLLTSATNPPTRRDEYKYDLARFYFIQSYFHIFQNQIHTLVTGYKWLVLNGRVAARRGGARWVEIFDNF